MPLDARIQHCPQPLCQKEPYSKDELQKHFQETHGIPSPHSSKRKRGRATPDGVTSKRQNVLINDSARWPQNRYLCRSLPWVSVTARYRSLGVFQVLKRGFEEVARRIWCTSERSRGHSLGNCHQRYVIVSACPLGKRASKFEPSLKPLIV